jgi:hypothetical protein
MPFIDSTRARREVWDVVIGISLARGEARNGVLRRNNGFDFFADERVCSCCAQGEMGSSAWRNSVDLGVWVRLPVKGESGDRGGSGESDDLRRNREGFEGERESERRSFWSEERSNW